MAKTEKNHSEENMEQPSCNCSKDCKCGCQEGKECTCENGCGCGCGCGNGCCCCKKKTFKLLAILIIFLAGMGFNELIHCCGRCPTKGPRPMPAHHQMVPPTPMPAPNFADKNNGGTVIIINADGSVQPHHFDKMGGHHGCNCQKEGCNCHKEGCNCHKKGGCGKHHHGKGFPGKISNDTPVDVPEIVEITTIESTEE